MSTLVQLQLTAIENQLSSYNTRFHIYPFLESEVSNGLKYKSESIWKNESLWLDISATKLSQWLNWQENMTFMETFMDYFQIDGQWTGSVYRTPHDILLTMQNCSIGVNEYKWEADSFSMFVKQQDFHTEAKLSLILR